MAIAPAVAGEPAWSVDDLKRLNHVARCLIDLDRKSSDAVALADPDSPDQSEQVRALLAAHPRCLTKLGRSPPPPPFMAGAIAERFYLLTTASYSNRTVSQTPGFVQNVTTAEAVKWRSGPVFGAVAAADCVVTIDPNVANRLLRTAAGSSAEATALGLSIELIAPCVDAGQQVKFARTQFRAALAVVFYRHLFRVNGHPGG